MYLLTSHNHIAVFPADSDSNIAYLGESKCNMLLFTNPLRVGILFFVSLLLW